MKRTLLTALLAVLFSPLWAQVQSPEAFLGYPLGSQFTYHHRIVAYYEHVAANSDRVTLQYYGQTNERRPLLVAYVTSPANHGQLEAIRTDNLKRMAGQQAAASTQKALVWLSYNVHGNEASSSEATMLTLYTLATTQDAAQSAWLDNSVVIMDPCINPDGRDRYANWYNQINGTSPNASGDAWEHHEPWPGGRPNHYLFDLNRDWAWLTQVESQQRVKLYQQWMPHIHVDFHEQGVNSPYYFAPAAEPFHEVITPFQREFQTEIGKNHARYFDANGWLYFTKQHFDLLYPSYGDTYPTFNGAIGMTYEQAGHGYAGLGIDIEGNDTLRLIDRLTHHHTTGLSTVEVASKNADRLVKNFGTYFADARAGKGSPYGAYIIPAEGQEEKLAALTQLLNEHQINYYSREAGKKISGFNYRTGAQSSYTLKGADVVIPAHQTRGAFIRTLFEPETKLTTYATYDITAWSLPYAYGLEAYATPTEFPVVRDRAREATPTTFNGGAAYGYLLPWEDLVDAQVLSQWLAAGLTVRFSEVPFAQNGRNYPAGTIIALRRDNPTLDQAAFDAVIGAAVKRYQRPVVETTTGWVSQGRDFGSDDVKVLSAPRVAVLGGEGTSSLSYGETWYFFDQVLDYPITRIQAEMAGQVDWSAYDVVVMPQGWYSDLLTEEGVKTLTRWVRGGGTLVAMGRTVGALAAHEDFGLEAAEGEEGEDNLRRRYADQEADFLKGFNPGSVYEVALDNSHPLAFGYGNTYFSLKTGSQSMALLSDGWNVGVIEQGKPRAGYVGQGLQPSFEDSMVIGVQPMGGGAVVYLADNPLFRAFWRDGHLMVANALFLVNK